jgi:hypothetical protein
LFPPGILIICHRGSEGRIVVISVPASAVGFRWTRNLGAAVRSLSTTEKNREVSQKIEATYL